PEETALLAIEKVEEFFKLLKLPTSFAEANLNADDIELMAKKLVKYSDSVGRFVPIHEADAIEIYKLA
ncbi:MAG TPA: NADH-dependent alcohol dehydrogenase, partial [Firmicutes bacterium]|nr:NADH-dependent alcohol dehydrogenase [Bacillota bacterium]